jgi:hypothetical protein
MQGGLNHMIATEYDSELKYMPAHSDKTANLVRNGFIFDFSFGATRRLVFKDAAGSHIHTVHNRDGSLFILGPRANAEYTHEVPKEEYPPRRLPRCALCNARSISRSTSVRARKHSILLLLAAERLVERDLVNRLRLRLQARW